MPDTNAIPDDSLGVVTRLLDATNAHDLVGLTACFAADYVNETPAHPLRGFTGSEQVRANWSQLFASIPDLRASIVRSTVDDSDGDVVWSEWRMTGTRPDGSAHELAGTIVFTVRDGEIVHGTFALEPVERRTGDIDDNIRRVAAGPGRAAGPGGAAGHGGATP
ncbi:nuclear transport factor 2 family protein [Leifsonia sp. NPDC058248]|uniref:nuclear transport factor 2 family protein n=1 Tax=Leifsonia sp. NPDC058248 TaxID=3346402 RepID=UPI0036DD1B6A